jgi:hypothetical protein
MIKQFFLYLDRRPHVGRDSIQRLVSNRGEDAFAMIHLT